MTLMIIYKRSRATHGENEQMPRRRIFEELFLNTKEPKKARTDQVRM